MAGTSFDWKDVRSSQLPNEDSIVRLIGAVLVEQNDEWQLQHRYMRIEGMAELETPPEEHQSLIAETDTAA